MVAAKRTTRKAVTPRKSATKAAPVTRRRVAAKETESYFASGNTGKNLKFLSSGCALFDEVLGGGWVLGRMANIVGDKSSGKTLLAIEACGNFHRTFPEGRIRYAETEAAFDAQYAEALGMPTSAVEFPEGILTVEDFYNDLDKMINESKGKPGIYILDSLDALSDEAEAKREIGEGSFGGSKPKKLGELFRRLTKKIESSNILLITVSQLRDKIGVTFGETKTRSGGRALDFYASQIVWLAEIGKVKKQVEGIERVIGVNVRANCKKNKVGLPFRTCDYPILFGYGVDDLTACCEWLAEVAPDKLAEVGLSKNGYKVKLTNMRNKGGEDIPVLREALTKLVRKEWSRIESNFLPKARKY